MKSNNSIITDMENSVYSKQMSLLCTVKTNIKDKALGGEGKKNHHHHHQQQQQLTKPYYIF